MTQAPQPQTGVRCPAAKDPAVRALIGAALLAAFAIWCSLDQKPYATPDDPINKFANYAFNFYGQFVFGAMALALAAWAAVYARRVLVADDEGLGYVGGAKIKWADITGVDARKLAKDSLLFIRHSGGVMKLAGWRLQNFRELAAFIDAHVPADKIQR
jgi:hypothetical protein